MIPSSGSAGSGEEATAATTKTSEERRDSSSRLSGRREGVKEGDSSTAVEENPNREQQTEESSTAHQTAWGGGTDEDEILQIGWGDAYVDSSSAASRTGWVNSDESQMITTTHRSGGRNSTSQTEHGATASSQKTTGLDLVENKKYRKREVEDGGGLLPEEVSISFPAAPAQQFDRCTYAYYLPVTPKTMNNHDIFRLAMWVGQNLRGSPILAARRPMLLMVILIGTIIHPLAVIMFQKAAKANMTTVVNERGAEVTVKEMGRLLVRAAVT